MTMTSDHLDLFKTCNRLLNILANLLFLSIDAFVQIMLLCFMSMLTLLTLRANNLFQELLTLQHAMHLQETSCPRLENGYSESMHQTWNLPFIRPTFQPLSAQISATLTCPVQSLLVRCDVFSAEACVHVQDLVIFFPRIHIQSGLEMLLCA